MIACIQIICNLSSIIVSLYNRRQPVQLEDKSKRKSSIFNYESTELFICLRRQIYMSHVNKAQPLRVKMICIAAIRVTRCAFVTIL
jgi:hypothetical protein